MLARSGDSWIAEASLFGASYPEKILEPSFSKETIPTLEKKLEDVWNTLARKGIDRDLLLSQSLISPATCCLVNPDGEKTVEDAFSLVKNLSEILREKYRL